jgi:hypothetical protein
MTEPETYWEDRARESEQALRLLCDILVTQANLDLTQDLLALRDAWHKAIVQLNADWELKGKSQQMATLKE